MGHLNGALIAVPPPEDAVGSDLCDLRPAGEVAGAQPHAGAEGTQELGIGGEGLPLWDTDRLLRRRCLAHAEIVALLIRIHG